MRQLQSNTDATGRDAAPIAAPAPGKRTLTEDESGELTAVRVGVEPVDGEGGPDVPARDPEAAKQDVATVGHTRVIASKNEQAILAAAKGLRQTIGALRTVIEGDRDQTRQEAQASGEPLPDDDGRALPSSPEDDQAEETASTDASEPGASHTEPGTSTSELGTSQAEPGTSTTEPGTSTTEPGTSTTEPGGSTSASGTSTSEPSGSTSGPDTMPTPTPSLPKTQLPETKPAPATEAKPVQPAPARSPQLDEIVAIIEAFAEVAADFEHPLAKQFIAQWKELVKTEEALRTNGKTLTAAYRDVTQSLKLLKQTGVFADAVAREWRKFESAFGIDDVRALRATVQAFGRFKRTMGRLARAGAIPGTFQSAADHLIEACGYNKDLSGAEVGMLARLEAARQLVTDLASLPRELAWATRIAQAVMSRLGAQSAAAAIEVAKRAATRLGDGAGRVIMRWIGPLLEKVAASRGGQVAVQIAERIALELAEWAPTFAEVSENQALRAATNVLASRLGLAFEVGLSGTGLLAFELAKLQAEFAAELYQEARPALANFFSARLFGKPLAQLKREIQGKPAATGPQCDSFFAYTFGSMLSGALVEVRGGWLPFARQRVPGRVGGGGGFAIEFPASPVEALQRLDPVDLKVLIAAPALKDLACEYLDGQFRRVFGVEPTE